MLDLGREPEAMKEKLIEYHAEQCRMLAVGIKGWQKAHDITSDEREKCITEYERLIKFHRGAVEWLEG